MRDRGFFLCALFVVGAFGCGERPTDRDDTDAVLSISPPTTELVVFNGVPANQDYTATLTYGDGFVEDVTGDTVFSVDSAFGTFQGAKVAISTAGKTTVYGQLVDKVGTAEIIARVKSVRVDETLDPSTPDLFGGPEDPAIAPLVLYPADDVMMPRNLGDFETHWIDSSGNNVFEVSLQTEFSDVRVYVPGGNGNAAAGPMASFSSFLAAEWLAAVGRQPNVRYQVRGVNTANPTSVGAAPARTVQLTNETLEGGLYYWAAASTTGPDGIYRHDMGKPGQQAEEYMTRNQTSGRCVACHVLSRDGTKMAITYDGGDSLATMVDVATGTRQTDFARWNFATFSADGNQILTVHQGVLTVRGSTDQAALTTMPAAGYVSHPDMSADGTKLVYVRAPQGSDWEFSTGHLYTRSYDATTMTFGAEVPLITDGGNNFYPSWSPDGQWVLFNRAPGGDAYNNVNSSLWVVKADGSMPPIQLTAFNAVAGGLTNSWGRWAPFQQTVGGNADPIFWVTVSSKRDFGVRRLNSQQPDLQPNGTNEDDKTPQIWMAPFFSSRATANQDPTTPAFRLPFQNLMSNNHIAQWTERIVDVM